MINKDIKKVCNYFEITFQDLVNGGRARVYTIPRWYCWKIMRDRGCSFKEICKYFKEDRTTVNHGIKNLSYLLLTDNYHINNWVNINKLNIEENRDLWGKETVKTMKEVVNWSLPPTLKDKIRGLIKDYPSN